MGARGWARGLVAGAGGWGGLVGAGALLSFGVKGGAAALSRAPSRPQPRQHDTLSISACLHAPKDTTPRTQIAGFIFGKNVAPEGDGSRKVAMTAPVTLEMGPAASDSQKIAMTSPVTAELGPGGPAAFVSEELGGSGDGLMSCLDCLG